MKTKILSFATGVLLVITAISCTTSDADPAGQNSSGGNITVNTGDLKLFLIDTAKVNTITMTGTNELTVLNRKVNSNSYISSFSLNSDASKFVYVDNQGAFANGAFTSVKSIRVANANGSNDVAIYNLPNSTNTLNTDVGFVKFGTSKIYFSLQTQTFSGGTISTITKLNSVNFDGSGLVSQSYNGSPLAMYSAAVTADGKYLTDYLSAPNQPRFQIVDRAGDNGAGSVVYQENITATTATASPAIFSYDNKFAYYGFVENQSLKVLVINMTTFTAITKTIASNFTLSSFSLSISVASDNNRGVLTVTGYNNAPSKSFVFNLNTSSSTTFNNNDSYVDYVTSF